MSEQTKTSVLYETLRNCCGYQVEILLRSAPEIVIAGKLSKFDLAERFVVVYGQNLDFLVNLDDVSVLKKKWNGTKQ